LIAGYRLSRIATLRASGSRRSLSGKSSSAAAPTPHADAGAELHGKRKLSARDILHAMSEENVETVRRVYAGVNARLEAPRELFDPDYEFDNMELWPDIVEVLGFDSAQEAMREYWETFEAYHVEIDEVIYADEGRVVDVVRDGGRMRGTDAEVWNRFFHVWTLRDGRIVRLSIHTDRKRALEAAGLSE
jgi:ketosteroid isomerase-like protein